ncbi:cytochrome c [Ponticaulis sp.]|uniref:cytochrome c n=1 Tax=Ponticaulis sp. TaxID=2020902 RepID=UPI000B7621A2|nr:cytochrome c [Ponticaulis sp.]MAI90352.1 hypothetical protein [Ponticaulis sp.]OUX99988.1 MAG: hypothetical protein CBB65_07925 [Hyphomonadaceae bacterium TMED5]|tara:strand:+ start:327038 stop:327592 length:555 start_codon:yes stop_codon:yes gene_type:complete
MRLFAWEMGSVAVLALVACSHGHGSEPVAASPEPAATTINQAMLNVFQPAFQDYGDTAFWAYDEDGNLDAEQLTDDQWALMQAGAEALRESAQEFAGYNAFIVAEAGAELGFEGQGFVPPEEVQAYVDANPEGFATMMAYFAAEAEIAANAAAERDVETLVAQSDVLYNACKACHMSFWYPGQR